jgi:hypothetical protein
MCGGRRLDGKELGDQLGKPFRLFAEQVELDLLVAKFIGFIFISQRGFLIFALQF